MDMSPMEIEFIRVTQRFRKLPMMNLLGDINRGEFFTLEMLSKHQVLHPDVQGMYVSDLARHIHVSPPAASRTLRQLELKGYIQRDVDKADRRNTFIRLTPEGEARRKENSCRMRYFMDRVIAQMGEEEMHRLLTLWNRLADIMESELESNKT